MIKLIALIKRRSDLSFEDFCDDYANRHAPLFQASIPPHVAAAIKHYSQNHTVPLGRSAPAYDCVTEFVFEEMDDLRQWSDWYLGDGGKVLRDDEERFMDTSQRVVLVTETHDIGAGH
jgi:hypothetical protein